MAAAALTDRDGLHCRCSGAEVRPTSGISSGTAKVYVDIFRAWTKKQFCVWASEFFFTPPGVIDGHPGFSCKTLFFCFQEESYMKRLVLED